MLFYSKWLPPRGSLFGVGWSHGVPVVDVRVRPYVCASSRNRDEQNLEIGISGLKEISLSERSLAESLLILSYFENPTEITSGYSVPRMRYLKASLVKGAD